jgi:hypothetical protein
MIKRGCHTAGVTLTELVISLAIIGIGILGTIAAINGIHRSIQTSKARTLAANLAQEKMQIIMQKTYYEILATTAPAYDTSSGQTIAYDPNYFPPETILEGSVWFTRLTDVQVVTDSTGSIQILPPDTPDTGMRQITIAVLWGAAGGSQKNVLTIQNIINNPDTVMSNCLGKGKVTDAVTTNAIPAALVDVAENIGWRSNTDSQGNYLIHLSPGTFDFVATAAGYYSQRFTLSVAPNSTVTQNFTLQPISSGTIQGLAWKTTHLVISQVVASTVTDNDYEYMELYNPTTYSIFIGTNSAMNSPSVVPTTWDQNNNATMHHMAYNNSWVSPYGYYIITNTGFPPGNATSCRTYNVFGSTRAPDACWWRYSYDGGSGPHALNLNNAGGFSLGDITSYTGNLSFNSANWPSGRIDSIAWSDNTAGFAAPSNAVEGTGMSSPNGIAAGEQYVRMSYPGSLSSGIGRAYDTDNNTFNFFDFPSLLYQPYNSSAIQNPIAGTPATGATVSVTDGLSASTNATLLGGAYPYAQFTVPGVATGTWTVYIDSSGTSAEIDNVAVTQNATTSIPNASTTPTWPAAGTYSSFLSTNGVVGTVSGNVTDIFGSVIIPAVNVKVGNTVTPVGPTGHYAVRLPTGTYDVTANPGNGNANYETQVQTNVAITLGDETANVNFQLAQGGYITGWVTRDGTNPLPGVTVIASDANGLEHDSEVSGSNGRFTLVNLTTGTYSVQPILDSKETANPLNANTTISQAGVTYWSSSFTIIGAMGTVTGAVTASGNPIQTGVLVVISTGSTTSPPVLNSAALTGAAYYADSSHEDGTYSVDVRGSSTTTYNVTAFYERLSGSTPIISTSSVSGVTVNAGQVTSGVNFAW